MRKKHSNTLNSSFTKIGKFQHCLDGLQNTNMYPLTKQNLDIKQTLSRASQELKDNECWEKFKDTFSNKDMSQRPSEASSSFVSHLEEPTNKSKPVETCTIGSQVASYHCKECYKHQKYGKKIENTGIESEPDCVRASEKCHHEVQEKETVDYNDQECRRSEEGYECERQPHHQVDERECDERYNVEMFNERCYKEPQIDFPDLLDDVHGHDEETEDESNQDISPPEKTENVFWYGVQLLGVSNWNITTLSLTLFVTTFLFLYVMSWLFPDVIHSKYILHILQYLHLSKPVETESGLWSNVKSFLARCVDWVFSTTKYRF